MCTYSFQKALCPCAKGPDCPQMSLGRVILNGEAFHIIDFYYPVEDLGSACEYQRRMYGRNALPTTRCPRFAFDEKRVIQGGYKKSDLACVRCVETCAPPGMKWQAPRE